MKIPTRLLLPLLLVLSGCGPQEVANLDPAAPMAETGISFSAKKGLRLSPETARFIGLQTAEVQERSLSVTQEITARVFRAATRHDVRALASARVPATLAAAMWDPGSPPHSRPSSANPALVRLDRSGEAQTGLVEAVLEVNDPAQRLNEGTWITLPWVAGVTNRILAIPNSALLRTVAGDFVYLENGAHLLRAAVKPGRTDGECTEIIDGLLSGDTVVVRPVQTLWMTELHHVNGGDACCLKPDPKP